MILKPFVAVASFLSVRTPPSMSKMRGANHSSGGACRSMDSAGSPAPAGADGNVLSARHTSLSRGHGRAAQLALLPARPRAVGRMGCQPRDTNCFTIPPLQGRAGDPPAARSRCPQRPPFVSSQKIDEGVYFFEQKS